MDLERLRDLERLSTLHARGVLDDEEFAQAKAQLLARPHEAPSTPARRQRPPWLLPTALGASAAIVVLAALVLVIGGATGPDRLTVAEYEEAVNRAHVGAASQVAGSGLDEDDVRDAIAELADELDALAPPEQGQSGHDQLVAAYREHVDVLADAIALADVAADAAADPSPGAAARAGLALLGTGRAIVAAQRDVDRAADQLADAGIDVVTFADPAKLLREAA